MKNMLENKLSKHHKDRTYLYIKKIGINTNNKFE